MISFKPPKSSLYAFLIRSFIYMVLGIVFASGAAFLAGNYLIENWKNRDRTSRILSQQELLSAEDYGAIKVNGSLGKSGYFEILKEDGQVVYCSKENLKNSYDADALNFITNVDSPTYYLFETYDNGGSTAFLVTQYLRREEEDADVEDVESDDILGVTLLNQDGDIFYTNMKFNSAKLSGDELNFLVENADNNPRSLIMEKYHFTTDSGETRFLLFHIQGTEKRLGGATLGIAVATIFLMILISMLAIIITSIRVARKVRVPLRKLKSALDGFARGEREKVEDYKGPREFVQVIETFNIMEDKLQEGEEEQRRLQEQKRKMLADITHDLKTPITVIQGYIDAIRDGLVPADRQKQYLDIIGQKTKLLSELINSFSDYSRLDHPQYVYDLVRTDLCEYLREYVAGRYDELTLAGHELQVDIPDRSIPVLLDTTQFKRVFENILSNALKYAGAACTISFSLQQDKDTAVLSIEDNGPGIPANVRDVLFQPFTVGDDARTSGKGTGLGMAIAKQITEGHQGTIEVTSGFIKGRGTKFVLRIPVCKGETR